MKQQGFVNIIAVVVVLVIIAGASYFVLVKQTNTSPQQPQITNEVPTPQPPPNLEKTTTKSEPIKTPTSAQTSNINLELIEALNKNNYSKIENLMSAKVQFTIESFGCCGSINRAEAIEQIKRATSGGAKLDFSQEQEKVKQVKQYLTQQGYVNSCTDVVVGIGVVGVKSVLTFCISQSKIIAIRLASSYAEYGIASPNAAKLTIISPNGGETLVRGTTYTIKWSNPDRIGPLDVFLVKGGKIQTDIGFAPGAGGTAPASFTWKVDPIGADLINRTTYSLPDGNDYKIRINNQDGDIFDESDSVFSIVSQ